MSVAEVLTEPHRQWTRYPPADESEIHQLLALAVPELPIEYIDLLRFSNGGEGPLALPPLFFQLYPVGYAIEFNSSAQVLEFRPGHFIFGTNGGLETIAFVVAGRPPWPIVMFDPIDGVRSAIVIADDMPEFVRAIGIEFELHDSLNGESA